MSIKSFQKEAEQGFIKSPAYLIYSEEPYLLKEALKAFKRIVPEDMRDFELDLFDMDSDEAPTPDTVGDLLRTVPFGGGRKVVILDNLHKSKEKFIKALEASVSEPPRESLLALIYQGGKLKRRLKDGFGFAKKIPLVMRENEIPQWIRGKARARGIELAPDAIQYMLGVLGPELGLLASELEKLTLIGKERIGREDLRGLIRGSADHDVFDLVKALKSGNANTVMSVYRSLEGSIEPYGLLGVLNWHYARTASGSEKVFALLNDADIKIKSSGGTYPLEHLLIRLLRL